LVVAVALLVVAVVLILVIYLHPVEVLQEHLEDREAEPGRAILGLTVAELPVKAIPAVTLIHNTLVVAAAEPVAVAAAILEVIQAAVAVAD
jgi:hypothetical protein